MFTLKLLGGAAIEGPDGPLAGRPAQRRRLALLALLAMSRTSRLPREKLIAYLWPERDADAGRRLLSDAVYVLNRALGADTLSGVGDEIRLNERLTCDARLFEAAADQDPEAAVHSYTGAFLDGFYVDGSEEFEAWSSRERERLATLFTRSLETVAAAREERGEGAGALEAWRRLAAEDPFNSRVAVRLAEALDRRGDRAGALQIAQSHVAFVRKELGLHAPAELRDLISRLQAPPPDVPPAQPPASPAPALSTTLPPAHEDVAASRQRRPALWLSVASAAIVALIVWTAPWRSAGSANGLRSVAVMPFQDVGVEHPGQYLVEGIADELTTRLGRSTGLKVAARTSAFALKDRQMDARAIGRALGVDALIEGSVRQANDHVRIGVRLVNTKDGYQIWSDSWDRPLADLPSLQEEIAQGVLRILDGTSALAEGATAPTPAAAYHLYLQGRYLWHQRTRESLARAAESFERATLLAPDYAAAFSGLADAYAVMGFYDYLPPGDAFPRARVAAQRALALDPRLAQAHASLAYVALYYDWNWGEAEASFRRAIELNPSYSVAHQWYANYLTARARFDEAVASMRRAQDLDPLSMIASAALGWVHFFRRDYDAAAEQCRRTLELNPQFALAHVWAGWAGDAAGRYPEAVEHLTKAVDLSPDNAAARASLARAQALAGDPASARAALARLQRDAHGYLPAYELAKLHLALGERRETLRWLLRAEADRSHSLVFLGVDPHWDPLRGDLQFQQLQARIGAASPAR